jgi:sigma-B regulation protein RsbU (phosphoserine phosphatase)
MSLRDRLTEDLKLAMKARDQLRRDVIRMIKAAVLNKEVEMKKDLDDAEMSRIMTTMIKQRKESVEQFEKGQRSELAAKERQEISIIESYLPKALSADELERVIDTVIRETGASSAKDMGAVMKAVMARVAGQPVDGKHVSDLVRSKRHRRLKHSRIPRRGLMSILIVDDSPDQQALLRSILGKAGHADVLGADSAKAAARVLNFDGDAPNQNIDLILMDVLMPGQDGVETCRQIKRCAHLKDIPVIMVTAKSDLRNLQDAFAAGAMDFIGKPVSGIELLARVSSALLLKQEMDRRKNRELELRRSNEELQMALKEVKVLRGLIPICASCKKIRNDGGFWQQLEEYLSDHSEAEFSHGLCQPCIKKLYPGVYQD